MFGIKCLENKKYKLKINKGFTKILDKSCTYEELHNVACTHYQSENIETYLATYEGRRIKDSFTDLEKYAFKQREKKRPIKLYLYYTKSFGTLQFRKLLHEPELVSDDDFEIDETSIHEDIFMNPDDTDCVPPKSKICGICLCTIYGDNCLHCQQNDAFSASLQNDMHKESSRHPHDAENNESVNISEQSIIEAEDSVSQSIEDVRDIRVRRFVKKPVRFRQSIGESVSDNLDESQLPDNTENVENKIIPEFGDNEVERFIGNQLESDTVDQVLPVGTSPPSKDNAAEFITTVYNTYHSLGLLRTLKTLIVQRSPAKFWHVLLFQKFNLKEHDLKIRFAGEVAADVGGPFREFLTLCMKNFGSVTNVCFGSQNQLCFSANPERVLEGVYFKLGQLVAVAIITLGRGPECLHPVIVWGMYGIVQQNEMEYIDDAQVNYILSEIYHDKFDSLLDLNIGPNGKSKPELKIIYLLSTLILQKLCAINQFKDDLASIDASLVHTSSYSIMKLFLEESVKECSFAEITALITYPQAENLVAGSNDHTRFQDAVAELEVLLAAIEGKEIEIDDNLLTFFDFLYFVTGTDRVPPHGFEKSLDITFDDISLPTANTCGLSCIFPYTGIREAFIIAMKFGQGFGKV